MAQVKDVGINPAATGIDDEVPLATELVVLHQPPPNPIPQVVVTTFRSHHGSQGGMDAVSADQQVTPPTATVTEGGRYPGATT